MGPKVHRHLATSLKSRLARALLFVLLTQLALAASAQQGSDLSSPADTAARPSIAAPAARRSRSFLLGRTLANGGSAAHTLDLARQQAAALPRLSSLNASWLPIGPAQVGTSAYGNITGRVTSIAVDPSDPSGNTVYLGTTGGGVWKSTNATGGPGQVTFTPLTDTLPVFSANAGSTATASLSIGAISVNYWCHPGRYRRPQRRP